ncbi:protein-tyrosine phosphatase-like protein, partial [Haematococcus lacustris]
MLPPRASFYSAKAQLYRSFLSSRQKLSSSSDDPDPVAEHVYLGGENSQRGALALNITHVVQAAEELTPHFPDRFNYLRLPLADLEEQDLITHLPACIHFIEEALAAGGRVLLHCAAGVSRSAALALAWLMWRHHLSFPAALTQLRSARPCVNPHPGFCLQLRLFEAAQWRWEGWGGWSLDRFLLLRQEWGAQGHRLDASPGGVKGLAAAPSLPPPPSSPTSGGGG